MILYTIYQISDDHGGVWEVSADGEFSSPAAAFAAAREFIGANLGADVYGQTPVDAATVRVIVHLDWDCDDDAELSDGDEPDEADLSARWTVTVGGGADVSAAAADLYREIGDTPWFRVNPENEAEMTAARELDAAGLCHFTNPGIQAVDYITPGGAAYDAAHVQRWAN